MASTFENDLRLEEIGTGEQSGTWGATTNTNLELIAEAFSYGTEAITTNANEHATVIADGSTDEGRSMYLKYTGTLDSTCTITISAGSAGTFTLSKVWLIENATSGGQDIIVTSGSGASITIKNGQVKMVASDGAGSGGIMYDLLQDVAIPDLFIDDDLTFQSDGAIINFGENSEIQLTHVHNTGLLLTETGGGAPTLQFRDSAISISSSADATLDLAADGDINLTAGVDINIPANVGLTFGNDGEKIEGDGTDLTIAGNNINLTASEDVVIPANIGILFGTGEKIEGDNTDLTITSGAKINLTATTDVHLPNNIGLVFGDTGEKIEGDGTNLAINSSGDVNITATTVDLDGNLEVSGSITLGSGAVISEAELETIDGVTAGTVSASKALVVDSNKKLNELTIDDVAIDGKVITMTGDTSDTVTITAGTNGTLAITTTDAAAAAANITITADGTFEAVGTTITLDSSGGINLETDALSIGNNGDTDVAVTFNGNSNDGVITWMEDEDYFQFSDNILMSSTQKIQFRDTDSFIHSSADGTLTIDGEAIIDLNASTRVDVSVDIKVGGEVQTAKIAFTDGDDAITVADGGGITAAAGITSTAASNTFGATSFNDANITNVADIALDSISADGTDINVAVSDNSATALTIKQGSDAYLIIDTANSSESVSIGTGISGTAITLGHSTSEVTVADNLTVNGDLTVSGTTTTVNSTTVNLNDHNIVLDSGNSTSAVINGAGITIEGGSGDDATFTYNTTGPKFELKLGSNHEDLQVDGLIASTGTFSGILKTDDTTDATSTTDGSLQTDGGLSVAKDAIFGNDVKLLSDSSVLVFGAGSDVTLTHSDNTGLTLNSTNKIMFNDASQFIQGSSATVLSLGATDEIDLTATTIDMNGIVEVFGTSFATLRLNEGDTTNVNTSLFNSGGDFVITTSSDDGSSTTDRIRLDHATGDISFYEDTGSNVKLFFDASEESLVVGASSTATVFEATGSKNDQWAGRFTNTNSGGYGVLAITAGSTANEKAFEVRKNTSDTAMLIQGDGKVGLGTNAPDSFAHFKNADSTMEHRIETTATNGTAQTKYKNDAQQYSVGVNNVDQFFIYDVTAAKHRLEVNSTEMVINDDTGDTDFRVESETNSHAIFVDADNAGVGIFNSADTDIANLAIGLTGAVISGDTDGATIGKGGIVQLCNGSNFGSSDATVFLLGGGTAGAVGNIASGFGFARHNLNNWGTQIKMYVHPADTVDLDELHEAARVGPSEFVVNETSNDYDFRIESDSNSHMFFVDGENNRISIGAQSSPQRLVHIKESSDTATEMVLGHPSGGNEYGGFIRSNSGTAQGLTLGGYFNGVSTERARIGSSGEIQIGGTTNAGFVDFDGSNLQFNTQRNPNTGTFVNTGRAHTSITMFDGNGTAANSYIRFMTTNANNTAATERMRITSDGDVRFSSNSHTPYVQLTNSGRVEGNPGYSFHNDLNTGMFQPSGASDTIAFSTAGSERLRILSGGGLTFNGDTATANALDDYEEGTWTPLVRGSTTAGTASYSTQAGRYTKIGNLIHVNFVLEYSISSAAGHMEITGFPFSGSGTEPNDVGVLQHNQAGASYASGVASYVPYMSSNVMSFRGNKSDGTSFESLAIQNMSFMRVTFVYTQG